MNIQRTSCVICSAPLVPGRAHPLLCGMARCDWAFKAVPAQQRCRVCGRALDVAAIARGTCDDFECQRAWLVDRPIAFKRQRREKLERDIADFRDREVLSTSALRKRSMEAAGPSEWPITITPSNYARPSRLPARRRDGLRSHLQKVIGQARTYLQNLANGTESPRKPLPPLDPPAAPVAALLTQACIACRGYCCRTGGEHAYITPWTMLSWFERYPGHSDEDIIQAYLAHVPSNTLTDGCVYQHARGCRLPRDMRGDTCNRFYCDALKEVRVGVEQGEMPGTFFVPAHDGEFDRGVFASTTFVQVVRRKS